MYSQRILVPLILLGTLVAGANPVFAQSSSPLLVVVIKGATALSIVDPANGKVLGRVPTGEGPHEAAASADGKLAFVSNYGANTGSGGKPGSSISVIDIAARKEVRKVELGPGSRPHGLTFAGGKLYFTAEGYKLIGCYDPATNKIDWMLGTGQNRTHMVLVSKDMNRMFTSNIGSDSVTMIERSTEAPDWNETVIPVGKSPEGIDLSPDGKEVWTATWGDGNVSVIDVASKRVVQTLNVHATRSNRIQFTPDGKRALVSDLRTGEVIVLDAAARKEIKRIKLGKGVAGILMSPDGSRAYAAVSPDDNIAVIDLKTLEVTGRLSPGPGPDGMAWAMRR